MGAFLLPLNTPWPLHGDCSTGAIPLRLGEYLFPQTRRQKGVSSPLRIHEQGRHRSPYTHRPTFRRLDAASILLLEPLGERTTKPLHKRTSIVYREFMKKDTGFRIRVQRDLREKFVELCRAQDKPAAQVLREFMREYVAGHEAVNEDLEGQEKLVSGKTRMGDAQ